MRKTKRQVTILHHEYNICSFFTSFFKNYNWTQIDMHIIDGIFYPHVNNLLAADL